jgi:hypothetical protein
MMATPAQPASRSWRPFARPPDNPDLPAPVSKVTTLLTVLIGLSLIAPVFLLAGGLYELVTGAEGSAWILLAAAGGVTVNLLLLVLVNRVRHGRRWAWITMMVILTVYAILFIAVGLYDLAQTDSAVLLLVGAVPVVMILLPAGPRSSRAYFRRTA